MLDTRKCPHFGIGFGGLTFSMNAMFEEDLRSAHDAFHAHHDTLRRLSILDRTNPLPLKELQDELRVPGHSWDRVWEFLRLPLPWVSVLRSIAAANYDDADFARQARELLASLMKEHRVYENAVEVLNAHGLEFDDIELDRYMAVMDCDYCAMCSMPAYFSMVVEEWEGRREFHVAACPLCAQMLAMRPDKVKSSIKRHLHML